MGVHELFCNTGRAARAVRTDGQMQEELESSTINIVALIRERLTLTAVRERTTVRPGSLQLCTVSEQKLPDQERLQLCASGSPCGNAKILHFHVITCSVPEDARVTMKNGLT